MNEVDYLVSVRFSTLSIEQKLEIKRLGPHRPDDLTICQAGKDKTRTFNKEWFKRKLVNRELVKKGALLLSLSALRRGNRLDNHRI